MKSTSIEKQRTLDLSTAAVTITATTEPSDIGVKLSVNVVRYAELIQNTLCMCRLSEGYLSNFRDCASSINLKLSWHIVGDVEITKTHNVCAKTMATTTTAVATAITETKDIKSKLSGNILGVVELNQNILYRP